MECREASKHHLLKFGFLLLVRLTLVSQLREDLVLCSSYLYLGVPNGLYLHAIKQSFLTPLPRRKKTSARGVSQAQSFTLFLFCFILFLLASFLSKIKKKLVL
jgi:hypothetical protein